MSQPLSWVSKTDIMRYRWCPYAFWLIDRGEVDPKILEQGPGGDLIRAGIAFEEAVVSEMEPLPPEVDLRTALRGEGRIFGLPLLLNDELRLRGIPDGIEACGGELYPIEIKHRAYVNELRDYTELAFYWMLLEPYRTRPAAQKGYMLLLMPHAERVFDAPLGSWDFTRTRRLIEGVRRARLERVTPKVCDCEVCETRPEVKAVERRTRPLRKIRGISIARASVLDGLGINNLKMLAAADPADVTERLREAGQRVSVSSVVRWQSHARAQRTRKIVRIGNETFAHREFILLDLEYLIGGDMWLLGMHVEVGDRAQTLQFWADTPAEQRAGLKALADALKRHRGVPVVTWNGRVADLPVLQRVARRHRRRHMFTAVSERHVDLYRFADKNLRLPTPTLDLKKVAVSLGYQRTSGLEGGLEAAFLYGEYCYTNSVRKKKKLRAQLELYNLDDLLGLRHVALHLADFCGSEGSAGSASLRVT